MPVHFLPISTKTADLERDVRASAGLCEVALVSKHLSMWDATSGVDTSSPSDQFVATRKTGSVVKKHGWFITLP